MGVYQGSSSKFYAYGNHNCTPPLNEPWQISKGPRASIQAEVSSVIERPITLQSFLAYDVSLQTTALKSIAIIIIQLIEINRLQVALAVQARMSLFSCWLHSCMVDSHICYLSTRKTVSRRRHLVGKAWGAILLAMRKMSCWWQGMGHFPFLERHEVPSCWQGFGFHFVGQKCACSSTIGSV